MVDDNFKKALPIILKSEGGYINHPSDPGGETNFGITKNVYDGYRLKAGLPLTSVKDISQKEVEDIYYTNYWLAGKCDKLNDARVQLAHFDMCVNSGIVQAAKILQRAVAVNDDGQIGPITISAVNSASSNKLFGLSLAFNLVRMRKSFLCKLIDNKKSLSVFKNGWMQRLVALTDEISNMTPIDNKIKEGNENG